jgi:radical SAM family protein
VSSRHCLLSERFPIPNDCLPPLRDALQVRAHTHSIMTLLFLNPPCGNLSGPYLGIPSLVAWLKNKGYGAVYQRDINIEFYDWATSTAALETTQREINTRLAQAQTVGSTLAPSELQSMKAALVTIPYLLTHVEPAKAYLRRTGNYSDFARFNWAQRTVESAYSAVSAPYRPHVLRFGVYDTVNAKERDARELLRLAQDDHANLFIHYFRDHIIDGIAAQSPSVIGISVSFDSQNLAAFSLARLLRQALPNSRIVMGGSFITDMIHRIRCLPALFDFVDGFVAFEGEIACEKIAAFSCSTEWRPEQIPSFTYRSGEAILTTDRPKMIDVPDLPPPDFDDVPLSLYFSPEPVLPIESCRGCYWTCAFCAHSYSYGGGFRTKSGAAAYADIRHLRLRYSTSSFYLVDECVSPKTLRHLSEAIVDSGDHYRLHCELRFDRGLTDELIELSARAGFQLFSFGLESANQRVLDHMGKGTKRDQIVRILKKAHECGIHNHVMYFLGFPTETHAEAMDTASFIEEHKVYLDLVGLGSFCFEPTAPVAKDPDRYGVTSVSLTDPNLILPYYEYQTRSGLSQREAFELVQRVGTNQAHREIVEHTPRERIHCMFLDLRSSLKRDSDERTQKERVSLATVLGDRRSFLSARPRIPDGSYIQATDLDVGLLAPQPIESVYPMPEHYSRGRVTHKPVEEGFLRSSNRYILYDGDGQKAYALDPLVVYILERFCDGDRSVSEIGEAFAMEYVAAHPLEHSNASDIVRDIVVRALSQYATAGALVLDTEGIGLPVRSTVVQDLAEDSVAREVGPRGRVRADP